MKILIISQYFWPEDFRVNDVARGLQENGHEVTVLTGIPNYPQGRFFPGYGLAGPRDEELAGVKIHRVPLLPRGRGPLRLMLNYLSFAITASLLGARRCTGPFDVILVYQLSPVTVGIPAIVLKKIKRAPMVFWVQDLWPESVAAEGTFTSQWILKPLERLVRFIYKRCDLILGQSESFSDAIAKLGVERQRIRYLPNSAEKLYEPIDLPQDAAERKVMPEGFRVMFAGNIGTAQDFPTILDAADLLKAHKEISWVILGDGRRSAAVREEAKRRGLDSMQFLGRHPMHTMPRFFAAADALLVTLQKEEIYAITIPSKVQAYLACGRPIIAALEGEGARIVRESGSGFAVVPGDARALADAVLTMSRTSAAERSNMGGRGRQYFETHFERNVVLANLEACMRELQTGHSSAVL